MIPNVKEKARALRTIEDHLERMQKQLKNIKYNLGQAVERANPLLIADDTSRRLTAIFAQLGMVESVIDKAQVTVVQDQQALAIASKALERIAADTLADKDA